MATYAELYNLHNDSGLKNKVAVAVLVAAEAIRIEDGGTTNHTNRLIWAASALQNPQSEAIRMYWSVLAANKDLSVAQIQGATDSAIQSNVDAAVDLFATG